MKKIFIDKVELIIKEVLSLYVDKENQKLVNYQIETGGKRIRPALAIISCLMCEGKINNVLYPAAGLEILHNYTLIIDDIIDNSNFRRKKVTTWSKFGKSIALCLSMDYSAAIFEAANKSKEPIKFSKIFTKTLKIVVDGQVLDILFEQSGREDEKYVVANRYKKISEQDYLKMISKKTASLFQACCQVGGICANVKKGQIEALKNYGFNLGMAFQIQDDILDIFGDEKNFGKKIGKDIQERKLGNIIILYALEELSQIDKKKVLDILKKRKINNQDIEKVIKLINRTKAREKSYMLGEKYVQKARENLKALPKNKWSDILNNLAYLTIKRNS